MLSVFITVNRVSKSLAFFTWLHDFGSEAVQTFACPTGGFSLCLRILVIVVVDVCGLDSTKWYTKGSMALKYGCDNEDYLGVMTHSHAYTFPAAGQFMRCIDSSIMNVFRMCQIADIGIGVC